MLDIERRYRRALASEFLPRVRGSVASVDSTTLGAELQFPPAVDEIPQPPAFCFDNEWQPHYSSARCEAPLQVKTLYLPVVAGARLVGNGIVVARNDLILSESLGRHAAKLGLEEDEDETYRLSPKLRLSLHRAQKRTVVHHDCTAMMLFDPAIHSFGMWMLKCLTKLSLLPLLEQPDIHVVVPAHVPDFYLALMQDLGIRSDRIIYHDPAGISVFDRLIVPPKTYTFTSTRCENPFEIFCYTDRKTKSPLLLPGHSKRRIYISRRSIPRRRLANEADVEKVFGDFDFHISEPSALTAAETVSMFANCEFIAGPHGSGLYNGMFSRKSIRALQLVPPDLKFENAFLITTHVFGGKGGAAGYIFGRMIEDQRSRADEFDYSWEIDLDRLREVLSRVL